MKTIHFLLIASGLLGACSAPSNQAVATVTPSSAAPAAAPVAGSDGTTGAPVKHASATGTIESLDPSTRTITITHGPVPALDWPAMTMTFQAPNIDLASFKPGDRVAFELSATGMKAAVISIARE